MTRLSHLDDQGRAAMVDVSAKAVTEREASAEAVIVLSEKAFALALSGDNPKGDIAAVARLAGIMAAKKTSELIPLCHPLPLSHVAVDVSPLPQRHAIRIVASAKTTGATGVEMEALTAASVAALTVYDMVKAADKGAVIETIRLLTKSGGKSGTYTAPVSKEKPAAAPSRAARAVTPVEIGAAPPAPARPSPSERDALRQFMLARHLRVTEWAKSAGVPMNELYGFLNGRLRTLSESSGEKLARAARSTVDDMLGRSR